MRERICVDGPKGQDERGRERNMFGREWGRKREKIGRVIWCGGCMKDWACVI